MTCTCGPDNMKLMKALSECEHDDSAILLDGEYGEVEWYYCGNCLSFLGFCK